MREVIFVNQHADKWKTFEQLLKNKYTVNPDDTASLYIQLIDDLSYAKTFYPGTQTYIYLNELSGLAHQVIYKNKKEKQNRLITFWTKELPALIYHSHRQLLFAFLIFAVAALVGGVSAAHDDSFVRLILGDSYVNMTLENIEKGDPMAVYKGSGEVITFLAITVNNIKVAFMAFVFGILFSMGTVMVLIQNGIMLGSFQYFFFQKGVLLQSVLAIWLHGTIEISVIIIASCGGLVMGNSLLFPGTYSRGDSFKRGARQGLKIVIGTVPLFILAGFIEGFLTRHASVSIFFDIVVIILSLALIVGYFVIYPLLLNKKTLQKTNPNVKSNYY